MSDHAALAGLRNSPVALARDHPQLLHNDPADCTPAGVTPRVFLPLSHDSEAHRAWVRELAERLVQGGVEVTLDQWDLRPGGDVVRFMDLGIRLFAVTATSHWCRASWASASGSISATTCCSKSGWRSCCGSCTGRRAT